MTQLAPQLAAILLVAVEREREHGRGELRPYVDATRDQLYELVDLGYLVIDLERGELGVAELTEQGRTVLEGICPECGNVVPQTDGRRPPHTMQTTQEGIRAARGSAPVWCPAGVQDGMKAFDRYDRQSAGSRKARRRLRRPEPGR